MQHTIASASQKGSQSQLEEFRNLLRTARRNRLNGKSDPAPNGSEDDATILEAAYRLAGADLDVGLSTQIEGLTNTEDDSLLEATYRLTGIDVEVGTSSQGLPLAFSSLASINNWIGEMPKFPCTCCADLYEQDCTIELGCTPEPHRYCRDCIVNLFSNAVHDEEMFPPRCCQEIHIDTVRTLMPTKLVMDFEEKALEYTTSNRTYCSSRSCGKFINPENIGRAIAVCPQCGSETCSFCKGAAHAASDCPQDPGIEAAVQLAHNSGWQRCQNCSSFVELINGCNHIRCRCGYQFCYRCGAEWWTCGCPQWGDEQLRLRLEAAVRNQGDEDVQGQLRRLDRMLQHFVGEARDLAELAHEAEGLFREFLGGVADQPEDHGLGGADDVAELANELVRMAEAAALVGRNGPLRVQGVGQDAAREALRAEVLHQQEILALEAPPQGARQLTEDGHAQRATQQQQYPQHAPGVFEVGGPARPGHRARPFRQFAPHASERDRLHNLIQRRQTHGGPIPRFRREDPHARRRSTLQNRPHWRPPGHVP
ncbi:MAG: hypothetical protein M1820_006767 [Bogoriella megaspora]|nr:MAG: hypothetical protein M1820_006767 [Bogoriella megaspora]